MHSQTFSRHLLFVVMLLCLTHSAYLVRPSAVLKRSLLRRRLLSMPGLRPKRQLFREDIPQHRPLTGNTYYLHAGFPHPSRWYDGAQVIQPDPNPITHHHFHRKPSLHDDPNDNNNNNHDHHHNNHVIHEQQHQLIHPQNQDQYIHHQHNHNGLHDHPQPEITVVNNQTPHTVNIHSDIVHSNGAYGVVDNTLGNHSPHPPLSPADQANFDPLISQLITGSVGPSTGHGGHQNRPGKQPKPHSDPEPYDDYGTGGGVDYGTSYGTPGPAHPHILPETSHKQPGRKPKTIIHYHPVTVGNIINFNDDNKPVVTKPNNPHSYGPPDHVPGIPLANKEVMLSIADPFIKTPFKTVNGPPGFLDFGKDENVQYGPPQHVPGVPLSSLDLSPMLPSFGPPVKPETEVSPPYGVALPVIAHLHSGPPRPPRPHLPPKHHRGKGRGFHRHHLHLHHIHHPPPPPVHVPVEHPPSYVVHGHVPAKFAAFHNHRFRSHTHHHHHHPKPFWGW